MAKLHRYPVDVKVEALIVLDEIELRALDALVGYGIDPFLKHFYEKLGKAYLQPHEAGLRSLFEHLQSDIHPLLSDADEARKVLASSKVRRQTVKSGGANVMSISAEESQKHQ